MTELKMAGSPDGSMTDYWCSPPDVASPLADMFDGPVSVDPCSNPMSIIQAVVAYTELGLVLPWCLPSRPGGSAFENPPYSNPAAWTAKMLYELKVGNVAEHTRLIPAITSSRWWRDGALNSARNPRIMFTKRLKFINPLTGELGGTCRFEPALVYYGHRPEVFMRTFAHLERWSTWGR